jgi:hypothetical protein
MPRKPPVPDTIGTNPLDQVVDDRPAAVLLSKGRRRPGERPDTAVLTVTVPAGLADELEQIIAITPGTDLDTLATEALRAVLAGLKRTAKAKPKARGKASRDGGATVVIVGD